jgi:hypothetical protein
MSDAPAKQVGDTTGKDNETLAFIVKEMTESMTGAQSTRHWAEDFLMVRHPTLCLARYSACAEVF